MQHYKNSKNYYWKPLNEIRKIFNFDDLLYNVLLAADMDEIINLCEVNKNTYKICHRKEFLEAKFAQLGWEVSPIDYGISVYLSNLYRLAKLTIVFLHRSSFNKIYINNIWVKYAKELNNFLYQNIHMVYPTSFKGDMIYELVNLFLTSYIIEYHLNQRTKRNKNTTSLIVLDKVLKDIEKKEIYTTYVQPGYIYK